LTQAVIVLDEFEPVVRRRDSSESDPPEFKFLVTGMLPKLRTLNKSAKEQSLVYCLATNYLNEVDPAAKREERFDLHIPIYHPDPISRFQEFLYRLFCLAQNGKNEKKWKPELDSRMRDSEFWLRVGHTISRTMNVSAQSLATDFFKLPKETPQQSEKITEYLNRVLPKSFFHYVLDEKLNPEDCPEPSKELGSSKKAPKRKVSAKKDSAKEQNEYEPTPVEMDVKEQLEKFEGYWAKIASQAKSN